MYLLSLLSSQNSEARLFVATQTGPGYHFRLPKLHGPPDRLQLTNVVLLRPVLAREAQKIPTIGKRGPFLTTKSGPGTIFGSQNRTGGLLLVGTDFRVTGRSISAGYGVRSAAEGTYWPPYSRQAFTTGVLFICAQRSKLGMASIAGNRLTFPKFQACMVSLMPMQKVCTTLTC